MALKITDVRSVPGDSAFLLDDGTTAVLYDSGFAFTGFAVARNIRRELGERKLDYILLTHSHYDHALGAAYAARVWPEVQIVAAAYADRIFQKPSARAVMRELDRKAARGYGVMAYEDLIDELRVDIPVNDGGTVTCGTLDFTVVALPGHTRCSVGYYLARERLLLGSETLGVYFGDGIYLPSCLVGYQMTLDSIARARELDIERILLPHYGIVDRAEAAAYLENSERVCRETAETIRTMLRDGHTNGEILAHLERTCYKPGVSATYPIDAFRLNTGIMIDLIARELGGPK